MGSTRRPALAQERSNVSRNMGRNTHRSSRRQPPHAGPAPAARLLRTASAGLLGGWVGLVLDALLQRPTALNAHRRPGRARPP